MAIAGEKRDQGEQDGGQNRDPTLAIESEQHDSQPNPTKKIVHAHHSPHKGACPRSHQRRPPEPSPGPPAAESPT